MYLGEHPILGTCTFSGSNGRAWFGVVVKRPLMVVVDFHCKAKDQMRSWAFDSEEDFHEWLNLDGKVECKSEDEYAGRAIAPDWEGWEKP